MGFLKKMKKDLISLVLIILDSTKSVILLFNTKKKLRLIYNSKWFHTFAV